jgi:hypothetical protein
LAEKPEGKIPLGRLRLDETIILKRKLKKYGGRMDWIRLAQVRDQWKALVNTVMNFRVPQTDGISCPLKKGSASWRQLI